MNLYDFTRGQLAELIASQGGQSVHASRLWRYLYREGLHDLDAMHDLPARLRTRLSSDACVARLTTICETHSDDGLTRKYLLSLDDGQQIETVLMRFRGRGATACLQFPSGLCMGCVFCATGQLGFARNLSTGEIVAQALHVDRTASSRHRRHSESIARRPARWSRITAQSCPDGNGRAATELRRGDGCHRNSPRLERTVDR